VADFASGDGHGSLIVSRTLGIYHGGTEARRKSWVGLFLGIRQRAYKRNQGPSLRSG
jgi:hypothetical protein